MFIGVEQPIEKLNAAIRGKEKEQLEPLNWIFQELPLQANFNIFPYCKHSKHFTKQIYKKSGIFLKKLLLSIALVPSREKKNRPDVDAQNKKLFWRNHLLMSCQRLEQRLQVGYFLKQTNRRRPVFHFEYQM
ncbi:Phospholipid-transporting ATPase tat-1 [Trichinella pseudospiralis]